MVMLSPIPSPVATLKMASTLAETRRLHAWLDDVLSRSVLPDRVVQAVRICLEEAVTNVVLHGYGQDSPGPIELTLGPAPPGLLAVIVDRAPPFDPTQVPVLPPPTDLHSSRLGGHGLRLIHRFANVFRYERAAGQNRLTLGFAV